MACTLIINPGSSSKKYAFYQNEVEVLRVVVSKEADGVSYDVRQNGNWLERSQLADAQYESVLTQVLETARACRAISQTTAIDVIGLRVVAPGTMFQEHRMLDAAMRTELRTRVATAPLHIPPVLAELEVVSRTLPDLPVIAVSDSAYHSTMPEMARQYSIGSDITNETQVSRYGYHGLSVASVIRRLSHVVGGDTLKRVVVCHIGSGVSVTAVRDGVSIDTTMGYAPGSGLVMASRAGDVDAGALLELMRLQQWDITTAQLYLQQQGGIQAMVGTTDIRHLMERSASSDAGAVRALDIFTYSIRKQVGAMIAALGGVDAIVCTATAGSRSPALRHQVLAPLHDLGVQIDADKNSQAIERAMVISPTDGPVTVVVIPTDELGEMARITRDVWRASVRDGQ